MFGPVVLLVVIALPLFVAGATVWLVVRIRRRWKEAFCRAQVVVALAALAAVFGALGTILGVIMGFGAVGGESIDPSQKARILAEKISTIMNCSALALAVWVLSFSLALVLLRKAKGKHQ